MRFSRFVKSSTIRLPAGPSVLGRDSERLGKGEPLRSYKPLAPASGPTLDGTEPIRGPIPSGGLRRVGLSQMRLRLSGSGRASRSSRSSPDVIRMRAGTRGSASLGSKRGRADSEDHGRGSQHVQTEEESREAVDDDGGADAYRPGRDRAHRESRVVVRARPPASVVAAEFERVPLALLARPVRCDDGRPFDPGCSEALAAESPRHGLAVERLANELHGAGDVRREFGKAGAEEVDSLIGAGGPARPAAHSPWRAAPHH